MKIYTFLTRSFCVNSGLILLAKIQNDMTNLIKGAFLPVVTKELKIFEYMMD